VTLRAASALCLALAILGSVLVPIAIGGTASVRDVMAFPAAGIIAVVTVVAISWLAKAAKFWLLTRHLRERTAFAACLGVSLGCDFAFVATPAGLGGYPATVFLFGRVGVSAACAAAIAAGDQVLDLMFFTVAVPLALLWLLAHDVVPGRGIDLRFLGPTLMAIVLVVLVIRVIGPRRWGRLARHALHLPGLRGKRESLRLFWIQTRTNLRDLCRASPEVAAGVLIATAIQWLARYCVLGLILAWSGFAVPYAASLLIQSLALHAGQWTGVPGGVGGADVIIAESLYPWVPATAMGASLLMWRIATYYVTLLVGGLAFALLTGPAARREVTDPPA
jgi:glycosyltransferase 2 family protein